uniref:ACYPI45597 protein n=1 Tax=Acyrthosiphon pisum TaxID=7029 RepID=C4WXM6_ACYPI|nr:ACYPI45597 [Acyrthosiphon pisum]
MSFAAYCVALASALAFVSEATDPETSEPGRPVAPAPGYPDWSLQYLDDVHKATRSHDDDVMFLRKMMEMDYLWWPILNEPVKIKRPTVPYFDQYKEPGPSVFLEKNELPFDLISTMMTENTFTGSDVVYAMDAFKSAMACSVLKHVSLQALMLHNLLTKFHHEIPDDERVMFEGWLVNMIQWGRTS